MQTDTAMPTAAVSVAAARILLGNISHSMFYNLVKRREIQTIKLGRRTLVTNLAISQCLARAQPGVADAQ